MEKRNMKNTEVVQWNTRIRAGATLDAWIDKRQRWIESRRKSPLAKLAKLPALIRPIRPAVSALPPLNIQARIEGWA